MLADSTLFTPPVNREIAAKIISALRTGKPPHEYVGAIHVGYRPLLDYFREKLDEVRDLGVSDVKFVNADFGRGKSHFLDLIRLLAFERGFVVSRVLLDQRDVPFDKLEIVIQQIIRNIATAEFRENGFEKLLRKWAHEQTNKRPNDLYAELEDLPMPQLRANLVEFGQATNTDPPEPRTITDLMRWFRGEETPSKRVKSVHEYLHALTHFFRGIGYSGFVVMLDEAEAISSLTRGNRGSIANENIRQIIDNDQDSEAFYFVFASTPTFFEPPPGGQVRAGDPITVYSYPALRRRVENPLSLMDPLSPDSVIVELPDLSESDFLELAGKIRDLAALAYGQPPVPVSDGDLVTLVGYVRSNDPRVATLVRSVTSICDRARRPGFAFRQMYEMIVERARQQVNRKASEETSEEAGD
jgi:hypothetical protein